MVIHQEHVLLWRMFLMFLMEIRNSKWFQCDVPDHIFHLEKDWG